MAEKVCYHSRLPCPTDGNCAACDLHKSIQNDTESLRGLVKESNAITLPNPHPYVKFTDPYGNPAIEVGIKGTF